jgi:hypothetical protein
VINWLYNLPPAWKLYMSAVILICLTTVISFTVLDGIFVLGIFLLIAALFSALGP